ncbi:MAG: hypothetical protein ACFHVJ_19325 [Aestuariibacter sp.]
MSLKQTLTMCDPTSTDELITVYNHFLTSEIFIKELLDCCLYIPTQRSATWLLKHYLENDQGITAEQTKRVVDTLRDYSHWEAQLHILQSFQYLDLHLVNKDRCYNTLHRLLQNKNKFVRAWAYNGLHLLAKAFPEYQEMAREFLEMALRDEAPSVTARIKKILQDSD